MPAVKEKKKVEKKAKKLKRGPVKNLPKKTIDDEKKEIEADKKVI